MRRRVIFGCSGLVLEAAERDFFRDVQPWGFILFGRNVRDRAQVRALVDALRDSIGDAQAPVLIDQEGGRVARLKPPEWRARPAQATFGKLHSSSQKTASEAAY